MDLFLSQTKCALKWRIRPQNSNSLFAGRKNPTSHWDLSQLSHLGHNTFNLFRSIPQNCAFDIFDSFFSRLRYFFFFSFVFFLSLHKFNAALNSCLANDRAVIKGAPPIIKRECAFMGAAPLICNSGISSAIYL